MNRISKEKKNVIWIPSLELGLNLGLKLTKTLGYWKEAILLTQAMLIFGKARWVNIWRENLNRRHLSGGNWQRQLSHNGETKKTPVQKTMVKVPKMFKKVILTFLTVGKNHQTYGVCWCLSTKHIQTSGKYLSIGIYLPIYLSPSTLLRLKPRLCSYQSWLRIGRVILILKKPIWKANLDKFPIKSWGQAKAQNPYPFFSKKKKHFWRN